MKAMTEINATKKDWNVDDVLNFTIACELGEVTIREYLIELSRRVWSAEGEFNGKRPFGGGQWKREVYYGLATGEFIRHKKTKYGDYWSWEFDEQEANWIIEACFNRLKSPT
jgi:hypothetical protein